MGSPESVRTESEVRSGNKSANLCGFVLVVAGFADVATIAARVFGRAREDIRRKVRESNGNREDDCAACGGGIVVTKVGVNIARRCG